MNTLIATAQTAALDAVKQAAVLLERNQARAANAMKNNDEELAKEIFESPPTADDVSLFRAAAVFCQASQQVPQLASALHDVLCSAAGRASLIAASLSGDPSAAWDRLASNLHAGAASLTAWSSAVCASGFRRHKILGCCSKTEQATKTVTLDVVAPMSEPRTIDPGTYIHTVASDATYDYLLTEDGNLNGGVGRLYSIVKRRR